MKNLLASLFAVVSLAGGCKAASTDTVAQQKVVEIHMATKDSTAIQESKHKKYDSAKIVPLGGTGICSGAFIDGMGDIITARHCVDGFDSFEVVTSDNQHYSAVVVATSSVHDLALIHIDRRNTPYFNAAGAVTRGETIFVLGSPLGITDTLSTGVIARFAGDLTLLDCGVLPGNSGGPVFNKDGELVGVVSAGFVVLLGMTHLNIAQGLDAVVFFVHDALEKRHGR